MYEKFPKKLSLICFFVFFVISSCDKAGKSYFTSMLPAVPGASWHLRSVGQTYTYFSLYKYFSTLTSLISR